MRRFRTSHCAFPWHMYMFFLLHREIWQLLSLLGIVVSWRWCYTSQHPKPTLRLVRLSTMMLHLSNSLVRARPDTCLSSLTSMALLGSFASPGIGTCGRAAPLDAGRELLANFMVLWSLCAPAIFDSCQQGPTATCFFYRSQFSQRLCALLCGLADGFSSSWGDQINNLLQKKDDHRPSVV